MQSTVQQKRLILKLVINQMKRKSIPTFKTRERNPKFKLDQLVRTADVKKLFSKGDSTNYSYKLYTKTEIIQGTIPSYKIGYLPESYNEKLLIPTKLSLEENNKVMKKLGLYH